MKIQRLSIVVFALLIGIMATTGCSRSLSDGLSIGVTDGLSDGISTFVADLIGTFSGNSM